MYSSVPVQWNLQPYKQHLLHKLRAFIALGARNQKVLQDSGYHLQTQKGSIIILDAQWPTRHQNLLQRRRLLFCIKHPGQNCYSLGLQPTQHAKYKLTGCRDDSPSGRIGLPRPKVSLIVYGDRGKSGNAPHSLRLQSN